MSALPPLPLSTADMNAITIMLAVVGGLYAYFASVEKPEGLPRQLVNALTAAALFGGAVYIYDEHIQLVFSDTFREVLAIPSGALPAAWPAALYFGMLGFSAGFTPSLRSMVARAQGAKRPTAARVVTNFWAILVQSVTVTLAIQIALVKLHVLAPARIPLVGVIAVTVVFVVLRRLYRFSRFTVFQRLRSELDGLSKRDDEDAVTWPWVGRWAALLVTVVLGGVVFTLPIAIAGVAFWVYFFSVLGWSLLLFGVALAGVFLVWRAVQYGATHLQRRGLVISALALVLIAGGLQVYQVLAA
ncbi:MAG TPA: hypothetical protein VGF38_11690 [Ktedonobacterales bacterium]|jgi:hypothetical protein